MRTITLAFTFFAYQPGPNEQIGDLLKMLLLLQGNPQTQEHILELQRLQELQHRLYQQDQDYPHITTCTPDGRGGFICSTF